MELLAVLRGRDDDLNDEFKEIFINKFTDPVIIANLIVSVIISGFEFILGAPETQIEKILIESLDEAGISEYDVEQMRNMVESLAGFIVDFALKQPNLLTTLLMNLEEIGAAHYPEVYFAWLMSFDSAYEADQMMMSFNSASTPNQRGAIGAYRTINVNCPVDVRVYLDGNLVAAIISDEPQQIAGSTLIYGINGDGEKFVILPADADYEVTLTATDNGEMTVSISDHCYEIGGISRIMNYYEIPITTGMAFTVNLPEYDVSDIIGGMPNGPSIIYALSHNGNVIVPDEKLTGRDDISDAYFMVDIISENENLGFVMGSGVRRLGNFAKITAFAFNDDGFEGWYVDDTLVSSEAEYRFAVKNDVTLTARFSGTPVYGLVIAAEEGGEIVTGETGLYHTGTIINIAAAAQPGYHFVGWTSSDGGTFANANDASTTFTMPDNHTALTANFEKESNIHILPSLTEQYTGNSGLAGFDIDVTILYNNVNSEAVLIGGQTMTVRFNALNRLREVKNVQFILALHDGNEALIDLKTQEVLIAPSGRVNIPLEMLIPVDTDGLSLRVMVWDSYTSIAPHTCMIITAE